MRFRIGETVLNAELRSDEVCRYVSYVAAVPAVRARVVAWLRDMTRFGNLVMEGRDIGIGGFPRRAVENLPGRRIWRPAPAAAMANCSPGRATCRTWARHYSSGMRSTAIGPSSLAGGRDARVLDTTYMNLEEVVACVLAAYRELPPH